MLHKELIRSDRAKCTGCNKCIRSCPHLYTNIVRNGKIEVSQENCVVCGECIKGCPHGARYSEDDTQEFMKDLLNGEDIAIIVAPAFVINYPDVYKKVLGWLKQKGVKLAYDVSFGADITTVLYVKAIKEKGLKSVIAQPCPVVVNLIERYYPSLIEYLSPIGSPMHCTAVYMRKYDHYAGKIAAISPCIAKADEFERFGIINYNVTFKNIMELYRKNVSTTESNFDSPESLVGFWYPTPGGLKESVEQVFGKRYHIKKIEGPVLINSYLKELESSTIIRN